MLKAGNLTLFNKKTCYLGEGLFFSHHQLMLALAIFQLQQKFFKKKQNLSAIDLKNAHNVEDFTI